MATDKEKKEEMGRVSVNKFEKAVKKVTNPLSEIEWNDLTITVRQSLALQDMMSFVASATETCFDVNTGEYLPELKDFAIRRLTLKHYTNLALPDDYEKLYDMIYQTDIFNIIISKINMEQFRTMMEAIDSKIEYFTNSNISNINREINKIADLLDDVREKSVGLFDGIDKNDIANVIKSIGEKGIDEEKIVRAYMDSKDK